MTLVGVFTNKNKNNKLRYRLLFLPFLVCVSPSALLISLCCTMCTSWFAAHKIWFIFSFSSKVPDYGSHSTGLWQSQYRAMAVTVPGYGSHSTGPWQSQYRTMAVTVPDYDSHSTGLWQSQYRAMAVIYSSPYFAVDFSGHLLLLSTPACSCNRFRCPGQAFSITIMAAQPLASTLVKKNSGTLLFYFSSPLHHQQFAFSDKLFFPCLFAGIHCLASPFST